MKTKITIIIVIFAAAFSAYAQSRSDGVERTIREMEQKQVDYLLAGDVESMEKNWLPEYTVNNPFYKVVNAHEGPIRARTLTYSKFERVVERVVIRGGTAIVYGSETVVPSGDSPDSGSTIHRRFTDVWANEKGKWLLLGRQASVVCGDVKAETKRAVSQP